MKEVRKCAICGKEFIATRANCKYCGQQCKEEANRIKSREYWSRNCVGENALKQMMQQQKPRASVTEIAIAAKEAGMSYGQYVVQMGL